MLYAWRERELLLQIFEMITGLRMNHAYVRVGGLSMDLPEGGTERVRGFLDLMPGRLHEYEELLTGNPIWRQRTVGIGPISTADMLELGVTGPCLRSEEHTSELQSRRDLVCRLLLEKKKEGNGEHVFDQERPDRDEPGQ